MKTVQIRKLILGEGRPKICAPMIGQTKEVLLEEARSIAALPADMAEWRVDFFQATDLASLEKQMLTLLPQLRAVLQEKPLLFTFRTASEGGERPLPPSDYAHLNQTAAASRLIDLLDVEFFTGEPWTAEMIRQAHAHQVSVVVSSHDFEKTPPKAEILSRLRDMQALGADIVKMAVMPHQIQDVLVLMEATAEMADLDAGPVITMAMSHLGGISRMAGEYVGSAVTFGSVSKGSAPGQLPVQDLSSILNIIHGNLHRNEK